MPMDDGDGRSTYATAVDARSRLCSFNSQGSPRSLLELRRSTAEFDSAAVRGNGGSGIHPSPHAFAAV